MKKTVYFLLVFLSFITPLFAVKEYAKRYPTDNPMEVYSPNNPPPAGTTDHTELTHLDYASSGHTGFQPTLVSGTNIKTINSTSLLGSGDLAISASPAGATGNIQYNNAGAFGASDFLTWDATNKIHRVYGALDTEKVTNGTFASSSSWTVASGWAISGGVATHSSNGTGTLAQNVTAIGGEVYRLTFDVTAMTVSSLSVAVGGTTVASGISSTGLYSYTFTAANNGNIIFTPTNTSRFSIDNVSLKKLKSGASEVNGSLWVNGAETIALNNNNYDPTAAGTAALTLWNWSGNYAHLIFKLGSTVLGAITASASSGSGIMKINALGASGTINMQVASTDRFQVYNNGIYTGQTAVVSNQLSVGHSTFNPVNYLSAARSVGMQGKYVSDPSYTATSSDFIIYADSTFGAACAGTISYACSHWTSESDCIANDSHGGCNWNAGNSCGDFNYEAGMSTCISYSSSGCTVEQASCSGPSNQYDCEAQDDSYGGSCTWTPGGYQGCGGTYESWCSNWSNGTQYDCENNSSYLCNMPGGDYTTCQPVNSDCSGFDEYSCESYTGCYKNMTSDSCDGTYYTGICGGTYGGSCSGSSSCPGIGDSTSCGAESGCTWGTNQTINLPQGSTTSDAFQTVGRIYKIKKVRGSGNVIIVPYSGDDIDGSSSYTLTNLYDAVEMQYFQLGKACDTLSGTQAVCEDQSGCSWITCGGYSQEDCSSYGCNWDSENSVCIGDDHCFGTAVYTKRWNVLSHKT